MSFQKLFSDADKELDINYYKGKTQHCNSADFNNAVSERVRNVGKVVVPSGVRSLRNSVVSVPYAHEIAPPKQIVPNSTPDVHINPIVPHCNWENQLQVLLNLQENDDEAEPKGTFNSNKAIATPLPLVGLLTVANCLTDVSIVDSTLMEEKYVGNGKGKSAGDLLLLDDAIVARFDEDHDDGKDVTVQDKAKHSLGTSELGVMPPIETEKEGDAPLDSAQIQELSALFPSASNVGEMSRMDKLIHEKQEKAKRIRAVKGLNFDAAASLVVKAGGAGVAKNRQDTKPSAAEQAEANRKNIRKARKSSLGNVGFQAPAHNVIALTHDNTRPDLSELELRQFHRPLLPSNLKMAQNLHYKRWKISICPNIIAKNVQSQAANTKDANTSTVLNSYRSGDKLDLSPLHGDFVVMEYVEERPPIVLNRGFSSILVNYYRVPRSSAKDEDDMGEEGGGEGDVPAPPPAVVAVTPRPGAAGSISMNGKSIAEMAKAKKAAAEAMSSSSTNKNTTAAVGSKKDEVTKKSKVSFAADVSAVSNASRPPLLQTSVRIPKHLKLLKNPNRAVAFQTLALDSDFTVPRLAYGKTKILEADESFPFLGELPAGELQPSIGNSLFKAPVFAHAPRTTDFLLIRTSRAPANAPNNGGSCFQSPAKAGVAVPHYILREIPNILLCGQIEPQKVVPRPQQSISKLQEKLLQLGIAKYLFTHAEGVDFLDIQNAVLRYSLGKSHMKEKFKKLVRMYADESREGSVHHSASTQTLSVNALMATTGSVAASGGSAKWYPKSEADEEEFTSASAMKKDKRTFGVSSSTIQELESSIAPEDVCLQERCNAAEYQLIAAGIMSTDTDRVFHWLHVMSECRQFKDDRAMAAMKLAAYHKYSPSGDSMEKLVHMLLLDIQKLEEKIAIGRYVFEKLIVAPWSTTECFVQTAGIADGGTNLVPSYGQTGPFSTNLDVAVSVEAPMEVYGLGDPSGVGEGFAFKKMPKIVVKEKKAKEGRTLVKTEKDIRRLTTETGVAILVECGLSRADAVALKRWDRGHVIREFATIAFQANISHHLHKFARGVGEEKTGGAPSVSNEEAWGEFRRLCANIWEKQKSSLLKSTWSDGDEDEEEDFEMDEDENTIENIRKELEDKIEDEKAEDASEGTEGGGPGDSAEAREKKTFAGFLDNVEGKATTAVAPVRGTIVKAKVRFDSDKPSSDMDVTPTPKVSAHIRPKPTRLIKKVERTIKEDGSEEYVVSFRVATMNQMNAVERNNREYKRWIALKEAEAERGLVGSSSEGFRQFAYGGVEEEEEAPINTSAPKAATSIKKHKSSHVLNETGGELNLKFGLLNKVVSIHENENAMVSDRKDGYGAMEDGYYNKSSKSVGTSRRRSAISRDIRLPACLLNSILEKVMCDIWKQNRFQDFRYPVNTSLVPGYSEKISNPICLSDIWDKLGTLKYKTAASFVADVQLLSSNAVSFNGPHSVLSKLSVQLLESVKAAVYHDKTTLGEGKDIIQVCEEVIHTKARVLNR